MSDNDFDYPIMACALILGDKDTVAKKTREGLDLRMDPKDLIFKGLIPGMDVAGEKFRNVSTTLRHRGHAFTVELGT